MKNIKKILCYIIVLCSIFISVSCSSTKQEKEKEDVSDKFDIKIATNILNTYMNYIMQEDLENAKKLYSSDILEKYKTSAETDLKIFGYKIDEVNEIGKSGLFKIRVTKASREKAAAVLDMYNIKVEKQESDYKITDIKTNTEKDAFDDQDTIRVRDKNNVKTSLLTDKDGIPQYCYPKEDKAKINKLMVPKDKFGVINYAYSGEKIAVSTYDKDSYIEVIKIDETLATQGQGDSTGGTEQSKGGSKNIQKETPIGKEVVQIDLIKDGKVDLISFSLEERFVLVQFSKNNQNKNIRLYDADGGDLIPLNLDKEFPTEKVDIVFSSFDKETLNFEVLEKQQIDKSELQKIGKWQVNLKDLKIKKL